MKKFIFVISIFAALVLNLGYYTCLEENDSRRVWFIKKHLTPQVAFQNIYADDYFGKEPHNFSEEEKEELINYCKYRWGIETRLEHLDEFTACGKL